LAPENWDAILIIQEQEIKVMKSILYLHGLESSNVCDKVDYLKEKAIVVAPSIDYSDFALEEKLFYIVEKFEPDVIIGSSMGGYVGMMLANRYNIDCVLFNPAIHSRPIEPNLPSLRQDRINFNFNPVVILGLEDDVIDPSKSEDMFEQMDVECEIERVDGMGHRVPFDVFVNIYNKYIK
jgi:pimeloyl-ACP methyl ester carboxylesterase